MNSQDQEQKQEQEQEREGKWGRGPLRSCAQGSLLSKSVPGAAQSKMDMNIMSFKANTLFMSTYR